MDQDTRKSLEGKIVSEIESSEGNIVAFEKLVKPIAPDNAIGRLSRMEAINAKSVNESALGAARVKLARLKRALAIIDAPEFGICLDCGDPIPAGRILLMPETTTCVGCAAKNE
ncbi:MAG: TraR/DksA C4-type zinc finger protein [Proteobacteria bacterium]|nr:TraR/DksA C4-type zinc finger protein [Pseudomonadota bacterium]MBU1716156.1 TraR/DksA C4-type zinc finger protein [Pseudomonadota bacterium]